MVRSYVPDAGDIVWVSFNPQTGHEQAGHRPAAVLSPAAYKVKTSLMVCCPMTPQFWQIRPRALIGGKGVLSTKERYRRLNWLKYAQKFGH